MKWVNSGVFASVLCAVHCAVTPLIAGVAPSLMPHEGFGHWVEWILFPIAYILTGKVLYQHYQIHLRKRGFVLLASALIVQIAIYQFTDHEGLLAFAHIPLLLAAVWADHQLIHKLSPAHKH